jgi:hypothetical protein
VHTSDKTCQGKLVRNRLSRKLVDRPHEKVNLSMKFVKERLARLDGGLTIRPHPLSASSDTCHGIKPPGYRRASFLWQLFMWQVLFAKCTCVYATNFIWQVSYDKFYLLVWTCQKKVFIAAMTRQDRKIIIVRWPITSNAQITLTSFFCWPIQTKKKFLLWQNSNFFFTHRKNRQSCAYRRANKTCHIKTCHKKLARL